MRILILGATGMLGYSLFSNLRDYPEFEVFGTVRNIKGKEAFFDNSLSSLVFGVDVTDVTQLEHAIQSINPAVVINCIGLIKQHDVSKQHVNAIEINALLPHQIARACSQNGAKLIHFSTDCVFSGKTGGYSEESLPDAIDLYGRSKCLGEVVYPPHLTLRTSIIGHELNSSVSLIDWFLSQAGEVKGFSKAIFSGLPTCYIAKLLAESVLKAPDLTGLYHLSVTPIDKYTLLTQVAEIYGKRIVINESLELVIDRSLNSQRLKEQLTLPLPSWPELINFMHKDFNKRYQQ
ncbi:dTDP-4-dehydrorhamnose reductase family protein [Alkalimarinus alittae]|uniref:dTDP-4-dehydrorhamnose reductase n=1 Tax=Alkalimarinus alittae TaxID=2961619 RepID=A0ABY6MZ60_9ALTE|nr:SDR family oxidoreductase [Alkalimarinus alittae]UZE95114.1 SDR family oxidoreductase [Alkalimarinus alittae]